MRRPDADAAAGAVGIGLLLVALFLPGPPPKTSDSTAHLTRVLADHRTALLAGTWIAGLGGSVFLWFTGSLHRFLRRDNQSEIEAVAASAGGVAAVVLLWCGISIPSALALGGVHVGEGSLVHAGVNVGNLLVELSKFGLAIVVTATCVAAHRHSTMPRRTTASGLLAAAILVGSALPPLLADHGFWQFGGPAEIIGGGPAALWVIWLSVHLARRPPSAPGIDPSPAQLQHA